jgi:hypothetical protein
VPDDPIFGVIEAHRKANSRFGESVEANGEVEFGDDVSAVALSEAAVDVASDAEKNAGIADSDQA